MELTLIYAIYILSYINIICLILEVNIVLTLYRKMLTMFENIMLRMAKLGESGT